MFSSKFISAGTEYCTHEKMISAPYLRKSFCLDERPKKAIFRVCGLGFYRFFLNGQEITKGHLASYCANPDHLLYYDEYDLSGLLQTGKNAIGLWLGNGQLNCIGGQEWDLDIADFRSAPKTAFSLETEQGVLFEGDERVKTAPSPLLFDDLREGEIYDARLEIEGWSEADFDDTAWANAIVAKTPKGELNLSVAPPLRTKAILQPIASWQYKDGYIFDFGVNTCGFCRTALQDGRAGQLLRYTYFERIGDDDGVYLHNLWCAKTREGFCQQGQYICKEGAQSYQPSFCWFGYRYVFVQGLTEEQKNSFVIESLEIRSDVEERGKFACSDEMAEKICFLVRRSDLTNLFHYPVDCPHREKNGWTADAALSCEQMLLQFGVEGAFAEWLKSVRKVQNAEGKLPGIVPTTGWGFVWGNGPAWDCVLFWLPYQIYQYRGDRKILEDNAPSMRKYLRYMWAQKNEDGLLAYGLGDWCQSFIWESPRYETPLEITDSLTGYDICKKSEQIFALLGENEWAQEAKAFADELLSAFRKKWVAEDGCSVKTHTQTAQAMAIKYGVFSPENKEKAVAELVRRIRRDGTHFNVGVVGGYSLFDTLGENGESALAYQLITQVSPPSYGYLVSRGENTLWESMYDFGNSKSRVFLKEEGKYILSMNHHFWGFCYSFFVKYIAGLKINPHFTDPAYAEFSPKPVGLERASYAYQTANGELFAGWERREGVLVCKLRIPSGMRVKLQVGDKEEILFAGECERCFSV